MNPASSWGWQKNTWVVLGLAEYCTEQLAIPIMRMVTEIKEISYCA